MGVAVQADGRILVTGGDPNGFYLARYNSDGSPDTSFGAQGKVHADLGSSPAVATQADGSIFVSGTVPGVGNGDFALSKFDSHGTPVSVFGGGRITTDLGVNSSDTAEKIIVQADGKVIVGGSSDAPPNLATVGADPSTDEPAELVADKGYHSRDGLRDLEDGPWKSRIAEKKRPDVSRWHGDKEARRAVYNNRARLKSTVLL